MANGGGTQLTRTQQQQLIATLALAFLMFLLHVGIQHEPGLRPILYIGVPTVLAIVVILAPTPGTLLGRNLKNATFVILELGILFADKFAYVLAFAPVAYLVAAVFSVMAGERASREQRVALPPLPAAAGSQPSSATPGAALARAPSGSLPQRKLVLLGVVLSFAIVSLGYRVMFVAHLETTSLLFVGIPTAIAVLLVLTVQPKSALATAMASVTFMLLLSAILFGEGLICILMAAPLAYLVAAIVGVAVDSATRKKPVSGLLLLAPIVLMSLEGTNAHISFPREQGVISRAVVAATPGEVEATLASAPRFRTPLPYYLRMSFPRPVSARGEGLRVGDSRVIHFAGGEGRPGDLTMEIANVSPASVTFRALSDKSKIAHWLAWEETTVAWRPVDAQHTEITWELRYRRGLDPLWYFEPWERYAVGLAGDYLIANAATPVR